MKRLTYQSGSNNTKRLPPIKFKPQPPALDDNKNATNELQGSLKSSTILCLFFIEILPSNLFSKN